MTANQSFYRTLGQDARFRMHVLGKSGEKYDRYTECWTNGSPAPNLESFAKELLAKGELQQADCIVAASRGGQVVLPCIWSALGDETPPAVVINGGCAMSIPGSPVQWPRTATTILILGGTDYFRGHLSGLDYVTSVSTRVPAGNASTAILYVREMEHMPQTKLMEIVLRPLLLAAIYWKASGRPPSFELQAIVKDLEAGTFSGYLWYLDGASSWQQAAFGGAGKAQISDRCELQSLADQELTRASELERLVAEKEQELQQLRSQLTDSRDKAARLQEVASRKQSSGAAVVGAVPRSLAADSSVSAAPAKVLAFHKGQRVQYWSDSQNLWVECDIIAIRDADGAAQVSVKPNYWLVGEEKAAKVRLPATLAAVLH